MNIQLDLGRRGDGSFVSGLPQCAPQHRIYDLCSGSSLKDADSN